MKFLKFLFTARKGFVLFVILAFALTVLYLGWVTRHQSTVRQGTSTETR